MADFITSRRRVSPGELQKLLFQAQGLYFQKHGEPLFPDKIEVARDGPIVRNVIDHLKESEQSHLTLEEKETVLEMLEEESNDDESLTHEEVDRIMEVMEGHLFNNKS